MGSLVAVRAEIEDEPLGQRRAHVFSAPNDFPDRLDQLCRSAVLGQITRGSRAQNADGVLIFSVHAEDEHGKAGRFGVQFFHDIESVLVRHGDIEQHHITGLAFDDEHGFVTVSGFASDRHSNIFRDDSFQACAHDSVIVNNNDFDHLSGIDMSSRVPRPGREKMLNSPPMRWTRSLMPTRPNDLRSLI